MTRYLPLLALLLLLHLQVALLLQEQARERLPWVQEQESQELEETSRVQGLGCGANRSLTFLLADSRSHPSLLGALGLEEGWRGGVLVSPQVALLVSYSCYHSHPQEELVHPGAGGVSEQELESLVLSWHRGHLSGVGGRDTATAEGLRLGRDSLCEEGEVSCLPELSTTSLQSLVLGPPSPGAVLLYTSPHCTHCTAASHVLHTVQRLLRPLGPLGLRFYMVDATRNDLPVQLTALSFPTVLVFPEHRKTESRVFPTDKELNTTNLLAFIVSNLSPSTRLRLALGSCSPSCLARLRLAASAALGRLHSIARRRPAVARWGMEETVGCFKFKL